MSKYVAIKTEYGTEIHMPDLSCNYATLCGMDGDDEDASCAQETVDIPKGKRINCRSCISIWKTSKKYRKSDFEQDLL